MAARQSTSDAARSAHRRRRVAERLHRGETVAEIAHALQEPESRIKADAAALRVQWRTDALGDVSDLLVAELAKLNADEAALRERWNGERDVRAWARVYELILACMARRAEMLGFDVPKETAISPVMLQEVLADVARVVLDFIADAGARRLVVERLRVLQEKFVPTLAPTITVETCEPNSEDSGQAKANGTEHPPRA